MVVPQILGAIAIFNMIRKLLSGQRDAELPPNVVRVGDDIRPAPGFEWVSGSQSDHSVRWVPGKLWGEKHLVADQVVGKWRTAAGYAWVSPGDADSLEVRWVAGREYPEIHVMTGHTVGEWHPAPGYKWLRPGVDGCIEVQWVPGTPHSRAPHVLAAQEYGRWVVEAGWRWVSRDRDDLRVEAIGSQGQWKNRGPDMARLRDLAALGLDERATKSDIEASFRRLVKVHHPDRFNGYGDEALGAANRAFLLLRAAYDRLVANCGGGS